MQSTFGAFVAGVPLRGQESILEALAHLDIPPPVAQESTTEQSSNRHPDQTAEEAMAIDGPDPSPSPSSALFSE